MPTPFDTAHKSLFTSSMAETAVLTDSRLQRTACRVIVTRSAEIIGEYGQVAGYIDTIGIGSDIAVSIGDTVTIADGTHSGEWEVVRRLSGDGHTNTFEVSKSGS